MKKETNKESAVFGTGQVGPKGQVVIPAKLRKLLNISPGDQLIFVGSPINGAFNVLKMDTVLNLQQRLKELIKE